MKTSGFEISSSGRLVTIDGSIETAEIIQYLEIFYPELASDGRTAILVKKLFDRSELMRSVITSVVNFGERRNSQPAYHPDSSSSALVFPEKVQRVVRALYVLENVFASPNDSVTYGEEVFANPSIIHLDVFNAPRGATIHLTVDGERHADVCDIRVEPTEEDRIKADWSTLPRSQTDLSPGDMLLFMGYATTIRGGHVHQFTGDGVSVAIDRILPC